MYYHICDHIYITQYRDDLILLDTKKDKYTICDRQFADLFSYFIIERNKVSSEKFLQPSSNEKTYQEELENINKLINNNIIKQHKEPYPFYVDRKVVSSGASNVDWKLPLESNKMKLSSSLIKAFLTLLRVHSYINFKGFYPTLKMIQSSYKQQSNYIIPQEHELKNLARIVNQACLIYPIRTKCLEWAITFVLLALKRKWKCNLEIGVQNYPFFAHAWVECNGKVVMDSQNLREELAIILNEPFRRLKP